LVGGVVGRGILISLAKGMFAVEGVGLFSPSMTKESRVWHRSNLEISNIVEEAQEQPGN
jgi:hypothetical protein